LKFCTGPFKFRVPTLLWSIIIGRKRNALNKLRARLLENRGLTPGGGVFSPLQHPEWLWSSPNLIKCVPMDFSPGQVRPGTEPQCQG